MESRRIVYYDGNTITRSFSRQSLVKRLMLGKDVKMHEKYIIPKIDKVFATKNCMWCPSNFETFKIICQSCRSCQYCGMLNSDPNYCSHCGNHTTPDIHHERKSQRIGVF